MITVLGKPQGKGRPRYTTRAGHAVAYTPAATKAYEAQIRQAWQEQDGRNFGAAALALIVTAYYPIPSKARKAEKDAMLAGQVPATGKPDLDNVVKACMDALNGTAYDDDAQITHINAARAYSDQPRIEFDLIPIKEGGNYV